MQKKPDISVIITHYNAERELFECLRSLSKVRSRKDVIEFILVDNDEVKKVGKKLKKHFPWVKYIPADGNIGFGAGCNLGRKYAQGRFLYFTNSDITVSNKSFDEIYEFIKKTSKAGIVSPKLVNVSGNFTPQATVELTPFIGLFTLSFINKLFPNNPIKRKYLMSNWDRTTIKEVEVIQLGAFMIRSKVFDSVHGFDESMFLYFEENELANKIRKKGWKLIFYPKAEVIHLEARGTPKKTERILNAYKKSLFIYFSRHYGLLSALLVEGFLRINKWSLILGLIIFIGAFLRFYRIEENLIFHGDLGVDYLAVRDIIEGKRTALLGSRTSHEWLYLAPLFYWIMAGILPLFNYHPFAGAYFFAVIGVLSVYLCYKVVSTLIDKHTGLIASFLIAISPAWVRLTRDSRFNAIAALLFFPFLFFLVKSIDDRCKGLFWLGLILGLSYSFFPTILVLLPSVFVLILIKRKFIKLKNLWKGLVGLSIPLIPFLIYNLQNKFDMIFKLLAWVPYRVAGFFGLYPKNTADIGIIKASFTSLYNFFWESILVQKNLYVLLLFIIIIVYWVYRVKEKIVKEKSSFWIALSVVFLVTFSGLFVHGDPPKHYYLAIFPIPLILLADFISNLSRKKIGLIISVTILIIMTGVNLKYYFSKNWFFQPQDNVTPGTLPVPYKLQEQIVSLIIKDAQGKDYKLERVGPLDYFEDDFAQNYRYLLWRLGNEPKKSADIVYKIFEDESKVPENAETIFWVGNIAVTKEER